MKFHGIHKTSLVNYPGKVCTILFVGGCNLKCGYCYNRELVSEFHTMEELTEESIISTLDSRKNFIDAITLSGGEPTIYPKLIPFLKRIKSKFKLAIKLDTNGLKPDVIKEIIDQDLVDMFAIDIKTSPDKYFSLTGVTVQFSDIVKSLNYIRDNDITYELRTTVIPGFFSIEDIELIKSELGTVGTYHLQQFVAENTLDPAFSDIYSFPKEKLMTFQNSILTFAEHCTIKGI